MVKFNDDDEFPRITDGWKTLREHYKFQGHHHIFSRYLGRNQFHIIPIVGPITPTSFPTWHTKTRSLKKYVTFNIIVTGDPQVIHYLFGFSIHLVVLFIFNSTFLDESTHIIFYFGSIILQTLPDAMGDYSGNTFLHRINLVGPNLKSIFYELEYD